MFLFTQLLELGFSFLKESYMRYNRGTNRKTESMPGETTLKGKLNPGYQTQCQTAKTK